MNTIYQLIERILPGKSPQIECRFCASENGSDVYAIDYEDGKLILSGNNRLSIAAALGYYIKHDLHADLSWCGENLAVPEQLPQPAPYRHCINQQYRVYMNYCTLNYSASWWDFDRWEKEIDFMALSGINMPLCVVGLEGVWYHTLINRGFSEEEALAHISGPAFLAWQWMGNIEGFAGPIPKSWIEKRIALGKRIIERMVSLDMKPIQQGFAGNVPRLFIDKYPDAGIRLKEKWAGIEPVAQLDPTDPLFTEFGLEFMEQQKKLFGSYGFYAADPFHESKPPVEGEEYLERVGKQIAEMFYRFDPDYTWVMQSWSMRKEIVCSIPKDKLLILNLAGGRYKEFNNFFGYNCVLGNLHNFGGRNRLHGDLRELAENRYYLWKKDIPNLVGTGLFMEGINQNPVYYSLAFDMLTESEPIDLEQWLDHYIFRRYGQNSDSAKQAWRILFDTVYARGTNGVEKSSAICLEPAGS